VLYEFIAVSVCYWIVAACIAELASAIPSSGGVYHWASVTPGKRWGRVVGFYAGYWNWLGWTLGGSSIASIAGNVFVQLYAAYHPDFVAQPWHVFVASVIICCLACALVCFGNRLMPYLNGVGIFFTVAGVFITIVVVAAMPGHGGRAPHATSSFVWKEWQDTGLGYAPGFVFVSGMLNGAFSVGTPDAVTHLAEEVRSSSQS
jgi:choline transport protein